MLRLRVRAVVRRRAEALSSCNPYVTHERLPAQAKRKAACAMATVTLTAGYLNQLKSHGMRFEIFDVLVPWIGHPRVGVRP
jgi:hypothetical protein